MKFRHLGAAKKKAEREALFVESELDHEQD